MPRRARSPRLIAVADPRADASRDAQNGLPGLGRGRIRPRRRRRSGGRLGASHRRSAARQVEARAALVQARGRRGDGRQAARPTHSDVLPRRSSPTCGSAGAIPSSTSSARSSRRRRRPRRRRRSRSRRDEVQFEAAASRARSSMTRAPTCDQGGAASRELAGQLAGVAAAGARGADPRPGRAGRRGARHGRAVGVAPGAEAGRGGRRRLVVDTCTAKASGSPRAARGAHAAAEEREGALLRARSIVGGLKPAARCSCTATAARPTSRPR
jgi:hypothetical protein